MNSALVPVFPADLIDADHVEHTTTYSTNADGTYIYGEDFDDRKYLENPKEAKINFVGPMSLSIEKGNPMKKQKDYLVWSFQEPTDNNQLKPAKYKLRIDENYNERLKRVVVQYGVANLVAHLLQLCKNNEHVQAVAGRLCPVPGTQCIFMNLYDVGNNGKFRKVPIQFDWFYDGAPEEVRWKVQQICEYLGQKSPFLNSVNDSTTSNQEDD
jgi:hypothetical protein|tara:strand:- start:791 stop:1426 length:636 start_codon:yes stop_codon:yes gene_type:complete